MGTTDEDRWRKKGINLPPISILDGQKCLHMSLGTQTVYTQDYFQMNIDRLLFLNEIFDSGSMCYWEGSAKQRQITFLLSSNCHPFEFGWQCRGTFEPLEILLGTLLLLFQQCRTKSFCWERSLRVDTACSWKAYLTLINMVQSSVKFMLTLDFHKALLTFNTYQLIRTLKCLL